MKRCRNLSVPLAVAMTLFGCQATRSPDPGAQVADSAGVKVIVNQRVVAQTPRFHLSEVPLLQIGASDGPEAYLLYRVQGAARLNDRTLVVADGGSQQLRYFDDTGEHLRSVGGPGSGPGEFQTLSRLWKVHGDTLLAYDINRRTVSVFDKTGAFVRSFVIGAGGEMPPTSLLISSVLKDGAVVVLSPEMPRAGIERLPVTVYVLGEDGRLNTAWGVFPGSETSTVTEAGRTTYSVLFGRRLHVGAGGDRIAVGNDDSYGVQVYDRDGKLLHIIRQDMEPLPAGVAEFDRMSAQLLEVVLNPQFRQRMELSFAQMPRHATFPAYEAIRVDEAGSVWVQDYRHPSDDGPAHWQIFSPEGFRTGLIAIPARVNILEVGPGYVVTLFRDELGIERVQLHAVEPVSGVVAP